MDGRTPDRYITLSTKSGQRNEIKGKSKIEPEICFKILITTTPISRVNERPFCFFLAPYYPHVYPQLERAMRTFPSSCSASAHFGLYSFPVPQTVEG